MGLSTINCVLPGPYCTYRRGERETVAHGLGRRLESLGAGLGKNGRVEAAFWEKWISSATQRVAIRVGSVG